MARIMAVVLALLLVTDARGAAVLQDGGLDDASFSALREFIPAEDADLSWRDLPWLATYHEGLGEASREGKPLLLWAMNGHPLGCT